MDNVAHHMNSGKIWEKYIDFELARNHMGLVNFFSYLSIKTPLLDTDYMLSK